MDSRSYASDQRCLVVDITDDDLVVDITDDEIVVDFDCEVFIYPGVLYTMTGNVLQY